MPSTPLQLFSPSELLADDEELEAELSPSPPSQPDEPTAAEQAEIDKLQQQVAELTQHNEATRSELAAREEQYWRADEREKQVQEARQAAELAAQQYREAQERPDAEIDPVGAQMYDQQRQLQQLNAWAQQQAQAQQQREFDNWVNSQGQAFTAQQSDYPDAVNFLAADRVKFWEAAGYPQQTAIHIVASEARALANSCRTTGKNFAAILYNEARARGYRPGGQTQQRTQPTRTSSITAQQLAGMSEREYMRAMANPKTRAVIEAAEAADEGVDVAEIREAGYCDYEPKTEMRNFGFS